MARHKSGTLKQQNKAHKYGRHKSNRDIQRKNKGKSVYCESWKLTTINLFILF